MDHDQKLELAAAELAAALERIEDRGTCPDCLAALLLMVAVGMRGRGPIQNAVECRFVDRRVNNYLSNLALNQNAVLASDE